MNHKTDVGKNTTDSHYNWPYGELFDLAEDPMNK
jgi:hypothetical protein